MWQTLIAPTEVPTRTLSWAGAGSSRSSSSRRYEMTPASYAPRAPPPPRTTAVLLAIRAVDAMCTRPGRRVGGQVDLRPTSPQASTPDAYRWAALGPGWVALAGGGWGGSRTLSVP